MKKTVEFSDKHASTEINEQRPNQLFVAMTGTKLFMIQTLERLLRELEDDYGKPRQGVNIYAEGTIDIQTPYWDGERF